MLLLQHRTIDNRVQQHDDNAERHLHVARKRFRIEQGDDVVLDEVAGVGRVARSTAQRNPAVSTDRSSR